MTSNLGSSYILDVAGIDDEVERRVREVLRSHFRPEFLNRIDEIIIFHGLQKGHLMEIVDIQMEHLKGRLAERHIGLTLTESAKAFLVDQGFDPAFGARPVKRVIQHWLADPLAMQILDDRIHDGDHVVVDVQEGTLVFSSVNE